MKGYILVGAGLKGTVEGAALSGRPDNTAGEHFEGWNLACLEEIGQLLYCSQQRFWHGLFSDQVAHLPVKIHMVFFQQDLSPRRSL